MGLVADVFTAPVLEQLPGHAAIGHVRYSTAGVSHAEERPAADGRVRRRPDGGRPQRQPRQRRRRCATSWRTAGAIFQSDSDTEVVIHLIARSRQPTFEKKVVEALGRVQGAYSLLLPHRASSWWRCATPSASARWCWGG